MFLFLFFFLFLFPEYFLLRFALELARLTVDPCMSDNRWSVLVEVEVCPVESVRNLSSRENLDE